MEQKSNEELRQPLESLLRNYGIKPSSRAREEMRRSLEQEKDKFMAADRIHNKSRDKDRDVSR